LDSNVEVVQFGDAPEKLFVEPEDVSYLGAWPHPILGAEPEGGEPTNVPFHGGPNDGGEVFLALGVAGRSGQLASLGPPAVSVHDASNMGTAVAQWLG
jgi:hypothetical protein